MLKYPEKTVKMSIIQVSLWLSMFCGWTPDELDPKLINFDSVIYLKNISFKLLIHFLQLMDAKDQFRMFDYGKSGNVKIYGTEGTPLYPLGNISVPIAMISSENDTLTTAKDAQYLMEKIPKEFQFGHIVVSGLNHADFHLGRHRKEIFFKPLLEKLDEILALK